MPVHWPVGDPVAAALGGGPAVGAGGEGRPREKEEEERRRCNQTKHVSLLEPHGTTQRRKKRNRQRSDRGIQREKTYLYIGIQQAELLLYLRH